MIPRALLLVLLLPLAGCRTFGPSNDEKIDLLFWGRPSARDMDAILNKKDPRARSWAMLNLARARDLRAADYFMSALISPAHEESPLVRATAAVALRMMGDPRALPALRDACMDPNPLVRADAVAAVGALGTEDDVPLLIKVLRGDLEGGGRQSAARALANVGGDRAVQALIFSLGDGDESVAFAAHRALVRLSGCDLPPRSHVWREWLARGATPDAK